MKRLLPTIATGTVLLVTSVLVYGNITAVPPPDPDHPTIEFLHCEKPIPYTDYGTPSGTLEAGYYDRKGPDEFAVLDIYDAGTSTYPYIRTVTQAEVDKLGYTPVPLVTKYGQTCVGYKHNKQYEATKAEYETYNKDAPPTKSEPDRQWE